MAEIEQKTAQEALEGVRELMKQVKGVAEQLDVLDGEKLVKMEKSLDEFDDVQQKAAEDFKAANKRIEDLEAKQIELEKAKHLIEEKSSKNDMTDQEKSAMKELAIKGKAFAYNPEYKDVLRSDVNELGGYLTPTVFSTQMIQKAREISPIRQMARVLTISAKAIEIPSDGTYTAVYGVGEYEAPAESNPTVGTVMIVPERSSATVVLTQDLIMNGAFDINGWVMNDVATSYAQWEGQKFLSGTGVKQPQGILTDSRLSTVETANSTSVVFDDVLALPAELKEKYQGGKFMFTRKTRQRLRREVSASDDHFLWTIGGEGGPSMIDGYAYVIIPDMPVCTSAGVYTAGDVPVLFGDLSQAYTIVDRQGLSMVRDEVTLGGSNAIKIHFHRYLSGLLTLPEAVVGLKVKA